MVLRNSQKPTWAVQKSFFQTLTRFRFWPVDFVLLNFWEHCAYEKSSSESKVPFKIIYSIIQHVQTILQQEKDVETDFQNSIQWQPNNIMRCVTVLTRTLSTCELHGLKKNYWDLKSKIRLHSFVRNVLEIKKHIYIMAISVELTEWPKNNWKKAKPHRWVPFWNNRLQVLTKIVGLLPKV